MSATCVAPWTPPLWPPPTNTGATCLQPTSSTAAQEFLELNNLSSATAVVKVCDWDGTYPGYMDVNLCPAGYTGPPPSPPPTDRYKKRVRVAGSMPVNFAFLPIIGIDTITISADAIAEAAALDLVLVIDESESMAYDAPLGDPMRDPKNCAPANDCHPFEEVRTAAHLIRQQDVLPL